MRIIAGRFRGRALTPVGKGDPGAHLRPTTDRTRESLFSMLAGGRFGDPLTGARVLDLFAGTGALGLEALSRGADHVTFVENGRKALALLRQNIAALGVEGEADCLACDARRLPPCTGTPASLVFLDPPYEQALGLPALQAAQSAAWLAPGALVVWEEAAEQPSPPGFARRDARRFGDTVLTFLDVTP